MDMKRCNDCNHRHSNMTSQLHNSIAFSCSEIGVGADLRSSEKHTIEPAGVMTVGKLFYGLTFEENVTKL